MTKGEGKVLAKVLSALRGAMGVIEECLCTCVDRSEGHQKPCSGIDHAMVYEKTLAAGVRLLTKDDQH